MLILAVLLVQAIAAPPTPDPNRFLLLRQDSKPPGPAPLIAVAPVFPEELRKAVQVVTVTVDVAIDRQGLVRRASIQEGDADARDAALRAAQRWVFEPLAEGVPERTALLTFVFQTLPPPATPDQLVTVFWPRHGVEVRALVTPPSSKP
jgi:TonB family protein